MAIDGRVGIHGRSRGEGRGYPRRRLFCSIASVYGWKKRITCRKNAFSVVFTHFWVVLRAGVVKF